MNLQELACYGVKDLEWLAVSHDQVLHSFVCVVTYHLQHLHVWQYGIYLAGNQELSSEAGVLE